MISIVCNSCDYLTEYTPFWEDTREEKNGEIQGHVIHKASGDIYLTKDSDAIIRFKMFNLFIFSPFLTAIQMIVYLGHFLTGQWIFQQAYPEALQTWRKERYACHQKGSSLPSRTELYMKVAKLALLRLGEALIKCATLPLATLLEMGATWIAIPNPLLARRWFAKIEECWRLNLGEITFWSRILNYKGYCMQPKRVWEQDNLYRLDFKYDENRAPSLIYRINKILDEEKQYFPQTIHSTLKKNFNADFKNSVEKSSKKDAFRQIEALLKSTKNSLFTFIKKSHDLVEKDSWDSQAEKKRQILFFNKLNQNYTKISSLIASS